MVGPSLPEYLQLKCTADGSWTLYNGHVGDSYHSLHGAATESRYVFIQRGLLEYLDNHPCSELKILEVGFGTGLNALLTAQVAPSLCIHYTGVDCAFPDFRYLREQGYYQAAGVEGPWAEVLSRQHNSSISLGSFHLRLINKTWPFPIAFEKFHLIFYDAFAPSRQPEMWSAEALRQAFQALRPGGWWVSYTAQGQLRRLLKELGFYVERLPGPPGKRHMTRARKT